MTVRVKVTGYVEVADEMFDFARVELTATGESEVESVRVCDLNDLDYVVVDVKTGNSS